MGHGYRALALPSRVRSRGRMRSRHRRRDHALLVARVSRLTEGGGPRLVGQCRVRFVNSSKSTRGVRGPGKRKELKVAVR